jgi:hypothetical protein
MSYCQVYLDSLSDLLTPRNDVQIREDADKGVFLTGLTWRPCTTVRDAKSELLLSSSLSLLSLLNYHRVRHSLLSLLSLSSLSSGVLADGNRNRNTASTSMNQVNQIG